jgi:hypothetical protein
LKWLKISSQFDKSCKFTDSTISRNTDKGNMKKNTHKLLEMNGKEKDFKAIREKNV